MPSISVCMIVKNEAKLLSRCLDSLEGIYDELIIADTGSTDNTKEIAKRYTKQVYDFKWVDDFSKARNYVFGKATKDYIYSADADEILDEENKAEFLKLKEVLLPEIEIVQMHYAENDIQSVLNARSELRPKLFKRLRHWTWVDPVHETIRTDPVVFDSDITILHHPESLHASRDFSIFEKSYEQDGRLSTRIYQMYIRELFRAGDPEDIKRGCDIFRNVLKNEAISDDLYLDIYCLLAKGASIDENTSDLLKYSAQLIGGPYQCAEVACILGDHFRRRGDLREAMMWYEACLQLPCRIDIHYHGDLPLYGLSKVYNQLASYESGPLAAELKEKSISYRIQAESWKLPDVQV